MAIYALALHPHVQEQVRADIRANNITFANYDQSSSSEYLNAFLNECLRLYVPTDGLIPRRALRDHYVGEFFIPRGSYVDVAIQPILTHPLYFRDSMEFDITRWLKKEEMETYIQLYILRFAFIPFGGGPRNCIGQHLAMMECKIILVYLIEKYRIILDP
jgi:cytochrome P450